MKKPDPNRIDLGIIHVVSQGSRDVVYLAHNQLRAFTVSCQEGKGSAIKFSRQFMAYPDTQWKAVFEVYSSWKRKQMPSFHLPNHSGLKKDGGEHPWRVKIKSGKKAKMPLELRVDTEDFDEAPPTDDL